MPSVHSQNHYADHPQAGHLDAILRHLILTRYPEGAFPINEGGVWFRVVGQSLGLPPQMPVERAAALGFWPWTDEQIEEFYRRRNGSGVRMAESRNYAQADPGKAWI